MILSSFTAVALLAVAPTIALADASEATVQAEAPHYTTAGTPLGTLLDDPAAKEVLERHIPRLIANEQIQMARQITLKDIQGFAPDALSDDTLAAIDADLAKIGSE